MRPPRPRASIAGSRAAGERDDRLHVEAHELSLAFGRKRDEWAIGRHTRVVDEHINLERGGRREHGLDPGGGREVGDQRLDPAAACARFVGKCAEPVAAARNGEHWLPAFRERERKLATEAG